MIKFKAFDYYRSKTEAYLDALTRFIAIVNGGGAIATITFLGTGQASGLIVLIPLVCFTIGLILLGLSLLVGMGASLECMSQELNKILEENYVSKIGPNKFFGRQGALLGLSYAMFISGAVVGVGGLLLQSIAPEFFERLFLS